MKKEIKRLSIDLDPEVYKKIKMWALERGLTVKAFVMRSVITLIKNENENNNSKTS